MKKFFISTLLVLFAVCSVKAQQDTIKIHVDGTASLESLMEGVWEQNAKCLRLTGTPTEEDVSYLKGKFANGCFNIYDLRHFELKRIPDRFFTELNYTTIILPKCLEYIGKRAFDAYALTVVLTGKFPHIDDETFDVIDIDDYCLNELRVSKDNPYLKEDKPYYETYNENDNMGRLKSIYSKDGTIFYFYHMSFAHKDFRYIFPENNETVEILEGTKYISGAKFRKVATKNIILPSTIDSIGDNAFRQTDFENLYCNSVIPPKLGKDVFFSDMLMSLYVPTESEGLYLNHQDWKNVDIYFINGKKNITVNNCEVKSKSSLNLTYKDDTYFFRSPSTILKLTINNIQGVLILQESIGGKTYSLKSSSLPKIPLLLRVELENGHSETVKILP